MRKIQEKSLNTNEKAFDILSKELPALKQTENKSSMPSIAYMRDVIRRIRNGQIGYISGGIVDIPDVLKYDSKGNEFLRYDSSFEDKERYIIFFTEFKRKYISTTKTFIIDGTFKSSPQGFYQIVVIHGFLYGKTFPLIYILLSNKTEASYTRAFSKCKELVPMNIKFIVTDFERALINALKTTFPEAKYHGCLFHLGQAAYKRVSSMGEITLFKNDQLYKKAFKLMLCLAFVPSQYVLDFYKDIDDFIESNKLQAIFNFRSYFKKNYLSLLNTEREEGSNVGVPIDFWNAYTRIQNGIPRTSNNAESWNRTLNARIEIPNPNIAKFITNVLQMEEFDIYNMLKYSDGFIDFEISEKELILRYLADNFANFSRKKYMELIYNLIRFDFEEN